MRLPSFGMHIANIIQVRSKKQMVWPYAGWCVALVEDMHSFGNWPVMLFPANTMRAKSAGLNSRLNSAIPVDVGVSHP